MFTLKAFCYINYFVFSILSFACLEFRDISRQLETLWEIFRDFWSYLELFHEFGQKLGTYLSEPVITSG